MKKRYYITSAVFFFLFILLIVLLETVNVTDGGAENSLIGLSFINIPFHNFTGVNWTLYTISGITGNIALLVVPFFGLIGLYQLIKRKSLLKVDRGMLSLGGLYLITGIIYVLFTKITINYRPIIIPDEGGLEASYPSSHTMLSFVIWGSAIMIINRYFQKNNANTVIKGICIIIFAITLIGRLFSGVHWFTDILGGIFISISLLSLFKATIGTKNPAKPAD